MARAQQKGANMSRKTTSQTKPDKALQEPAPTSEAERSIAQRLLEHGDKRMKPPRLKFCRNEQTLEVSFDCDDPARGLLAFHSTTGLNNFRAVDLLLDQLTRLGGADIETLDPTRANHAIAMLDELKPSDGQEAMLTAQMVAVHMAAMDCLARAMHPSQSFAGRELNLKHGAKLSRIYAEQVAALDKHRRKGQQTVTVEHVHVHEGGQAIVGAVATQAHEPGGWG